MSDDNSLSNVEARLNVYHVSRSRESIQAGMTWAELHQYLQLFWANQRSKILSELTPSQRSERRRISFQRRTLPDSFLEVCDSHKLLLLPENMLDSKDSDIWSGHESVDFATDDQQDILQTPVELNQVKFGQNEIIESELNSKFLVLAPPGTGKTYTVLQRLVFLAKNQFGGDLSQVLIVSFSRVAASEVRQRLERLVEEEKEETLFQLPEIRTLDSFTGSALHALDFQSDGHDYETNIRNFAKIIEGNFSEELQRNAINFLQQQIKIVVVDEVQDIVGARARLVNSILFALRGVDPGVLILGDVRQAIFGFQLEKMSERNPDKDKTPYWLLKQIRSQYKEIVKVEFEKSRRFSPDILPLINTLKSAMDSMRQGVWPGEQPDFTRLRTIVKNDVPLLDHPIDLCGALTKGKRTAILARGNRMVRRLEVACAKLLADHKRKVKVVFGSGNEGLPPWIARTFQAESPETILAADSFRKLYLQRVRGKISDATAALDWLTIAFNIDPRSFTVRDILDGVKRTESSPTDLKGDIEENECWISTIHQAKGREFDIVVVAEAENIPKSIPEESRCLYVAASRAKQHLFRCDGADWLPHIFYWDERMVDKIDEPDSERFTKIQDGVWYTFEGPSKTLKLYAPDGINFVLEVEACDVMSPWPIQLNQKFVNGIPDEVVGFKEHSKKKLGNTSVYENVFSCRIARLKTVVDGMGRLSLVPEMSGLITKRKS